MDLTGRVFGRLTVLARVGEGYWSCSCTCGRTKLIWGQSLQRGLTASCGCLSAALAAERNRRHGHTAGGQRSRTFRIWVAMRRRCHDPKSGRAYRAYGGRGITVVPAWRADFGTFLADMGECPEGFTLDRIDGSKGYGPGNCRWASYRTQAANTTRTIRVTFGGEEMSLMEFARRRGVSYGALRARVTYRHQDPIRAAEEMLARLAVEIEATRSWIRRAQARRASRRPA